MEPGPATLYISTTLDLDNWVLIYPAKAKSQSDAFYKAVMQQGPRPNSAT